MVRVSGRPRCQRGRFDERRTRVTEEWQFPLTGKGV